MVGTTSAVWARCSNLRTSSSTISFGASRFLAPVSNVRLNHLLQIVDVVNEDSVQVVQAGSISRGTAMSMKNMGRFLRAWRNFSPCSLRKMAWGAPVELMMMSAQGAVS